jgi:hypothetical protein
MNCKVGDRVRFLNDVGGGKVTRIVKNTAYVLDDDGFEIPILLSEVVVIDKVSDSSFQTKKPNVQEDVEVIESKEITNKSINSNSIDNLVFSEIDFSSTLNEEIDPEGDLLGLLIAFVPKDENKITDSDQELYIINDSAYRVFYAISRWKDKKLVPLKAGFLYPDSKELVKSFKRELLNDDITLNVQTLFFKNADFIPQQPEFFDLRINPTKFFRAGSFTENDFFDEKAIIYSIADTKKEEVLKTLTKKAINQSISEKDSKKIVIEKPKISEIEEVDLHIEELVDNPMHLSPGEMIEIQISRFKVALDGAIIGKTRKIVFIHGVGNGKLKHEIRKELEKNYSKLRYQDASFREYGYGATMVFVR